MIADEVDSQLTQSIDSFLNMQQRISVASKAEIAAIGVPRQSAVT
jgi:hypothetical protein